MVTSEPVPYTSTRQHSPLRLLQRSGRGFVSHHLEHLYDDHSEVYPDRP